MNEEGSFRLSPTALRDVAYVLTLVFGGGVFYNNQSNHSEKIRDLTNRSDVKEHRISELERRISVLEAEQIEQNRRITDEEQELREHISHDVILQAGKR